MSTMLAIHAAGLWSGLLILFMIGLSAVTVRRRRRHLVAFGDGGNEELTVAARAFGNAAEYIPVALIALVLLALTGAPSWMIHALGATLLIGRGIHAFGLIYQRGPSVGRVAGMMLTYAVLLIAAVSLIAYGVV